MSAKKRRDDMINSLESSNDPIKGQEFAEEYSVTRQVIVKDIAILKAKGHKIISTPAGYKLDKEEKGIEEIIAVNHKSNEIYDELRIVVKHGGVVKDVVIEHPVYGQITATLMLKSFYDIEKMEERMVEEKAKPLSLLTDGVHLHTIIAENKEVMERILNDLKIAGFLLSENE